MEKLRILFTGDSITDVNRTDMVRMTEEWMSRDPNATPQQREGGCQPGAGLRLPAAGGLPAGRPGARPLRVFKPGHLRQPGGGFGRPYQRDCINLRPDVISILIGVNDVWHELGEHNGVDAPKFRRVVRGDAPGNHPCPARGEAHFAGALCPPRAPPHWRTGDTFRQEVDLRREVVRDLAKSYWEKQDLYIPCIDTQKLFDEAAARSCPGVWSADGVHPTPAGHWLLAQEWLRCFKEL